MKPTATQLRLLRDHRQETKLWLSIYRPEILWAAQVSPIEYPEFPVAKGSRILRYYNVTTGDYSGVLSGMTLLVGTTLGGYDKGRIRIVSVGPTTITVAENSHIDWAANDYLTAINYVEPWPIFPRLVQQDEDVLWYKDYSIEYTNQNEAEFLGFFPNMGGNVMAFRDPASGKAQVYYSASGTYSVSGSDWTADWHFEGGLVTGSSSRAPGYIEYDTPGHYRTRLTMTNASGTSESSYRFVSIYDYPDAGVNTPILKWGLLSLEGSRESGGYSARIWVDSTVDWVVDGGLVVLAADDWYGDTKRSIGGNAPNRDSIVFSGYIAEGSITYDYAKSRVEFEVKSPSLYMQDMETFSVSVESVETPTAWYELEDMDCRRALYHYMRWHSTILMCCDFEFRGTDYKIQYFDADRESLYDALQTLMNGTLIGDVVCDRQGKIWAEVDVSATDDAVSALLAVIDLERGDWKDEPNIVERTTPELSYLEYGGIYYLGPGFEDASGAYMAAAPGLTPGYRGKVERRQGLALGGQAQLNTLVGNVYAFRNSRYPEATFHLAGNYRMFDIAPQEIIRLDMLAEDTNRGLVFYNHPFAVRSVILEHDPSTSQMLVTIRTVEVTAGVDGDTLAIPVTPPDDGGNPPDNPPPVPPPLPPPAPIAKTFGWSFVFDGGADPVPTGYKPGVEIPWNATITSVKMTAPVAGSVELALKYCGFLTLPGNGTDMVGSGEAPQLANSAAAGVDISNWAVLALGAGSWIYINVVSCDLSKFTLSISGLAYT